MIPRAEVFPEFSPALFISLGLRLFLFRLLPRLTGWRPRKSIVNKLNNKHG